MESAVADDYPTLSQLLDEEEEERRQLVEEDDFASLEELLHQSDEEDSAAAHSSTRPTPTQLSTQPTQPTQSTQPTQVLSPRRSPESDERYENVVSDVDELAATQVVQQRSWAEESQSQSQRPEDEQDTASRVASVGVTVSCGVSEWQASPELSLEGGSDDSRVLARSRLLHTGRILLSNSSSLTPTPG